MATDTQSIIKGDKLTKKFGEFEALSDVNFSVEENQLNSIIGPNGAGKTTLFNIITGKMPPTFGKIVYKGETINDLTHEQRAQIGIARSYQENQLFSDQTVVENVRIARQTSRLGEFTFDIFSNANEYLRDEALELLTMFQLREEADTIAKNLSHGDKRRLGIVIALATQPDVLLLDEPTSGMSPDATQILSNDLIDIHNKYELTTLMVEHDMSVVREVSDKIIVLNHGEILATGNPEEVSDNKEVQEAYLGGVRNESGDL